LLGQINQPLLNDFINSMFSQAYSGFSFPSELLTSRYAKPLDMFGYAFCLQTGCLVT
jgi:hypothetical protein